MPRIANSLGRACTTSSLAPRPLPQSSSRFVIFLPYIHIHIIIILPLAQKCSFHCSLPAFAFILNGLFSFVHNAVAVFSLSRSRLVALRFATLFLHICLPFPSPFLPLICLSFFFAFETCTRQVESYTLLTFFTCTYFVGFSSSLVLHIHMFSVSLSVCLSLSSVPACTK